MNQHTLKKACSFEGKGLHTEGYYHMSVKPAGLGEGIRFVRTDLPEGSNVVEALAENITDTSRSTKIAQGEASVQTIEHIMSALTGMGVDNAVIETDGPEVPILDGSASFYVKAFASDGLEDQGAERKYIEVPQTIEIHDDKTGGWVKIEPADAMSFDSKVDFGSHVLGVQEARWDESVDYASQIGICRTFVFFHEIQYLLANNLIKGGDVDNAIVVCEYPVKDEVVAQMAKLFNHPDIRVREDGYLTNLELHFPNECGRHKLLDLIGDMRLCGGFMNAKVTAFKPGHTINSYASKAFRKALGFEK